MKEGLIKKVVVFGGKTGSQNKRDDSQFGPFQLERVKGPLLKLSSSSAVFTLTTRLTQ